MRRSRFFIALFTLYFFLFSFSTYFLLPSPVRASSTTTSFLYDGDGVRMAKIEEGKTTLYIGETEKEVETGKITRYYSQGGKRIAVKDQSGVNYIVADHLGSTRSLTNSSGTKISEAKYYPYGQLRSQPAPLLSRQYTGQINDSSTQLYFYNARYYDPKNGLFISPDIIANNKTESGSLNRFAYTQGNPIRFTDETGRDIPCSFFGNCDRIKQLVAGGGTTPCGNGDIGCQARHKFFSLVYQIPFIGPELVKNELTVDEKINAEVSSLIPGPAAIAYGGPAVPQAVRNAQTVLKTYQNSSALQFIGRALRSGDETLISNATTEVQQGIFRKYGTVVRWANERELTAGIVDARNLGSYLERTNEIVLNPAMRNLSPRVFLEELGHEIGATYLSRAFGGKGRIPELFEDYYTTHLLDDLLRSGEDVLRQKFGSDF